MMLHDQQKKQHVVFSGFLLLCMGFANVFKMQAAIAMCHSAGAFIFLSHSLVLIQCNVTLHPFLQKRLRRCFALPLSPLLICMFS